MKVIAEVIEPQAITVDRDGVFPRASMDALASVGVLGLLSAEEVGGLGKGMREAAHVVEQVARACGSTAMVLTMHYSGVAGIEAHGPRALREEIANNRHITTLALSEVGSRSHFWVPLSTATPQGENSVRIDAKKSFSTSAGYADSYVWSSKPMAGEALSTLWIMPGKAPGMSFPVPFDGFGLRGNASGPITAEGVILPRDAMLGKDGGGTDILLGALFPNFQVYSTACYLGIMEAATAKTIAHVTGTRFAHLSQSLADLPTIRNYLARMRVKTDMLRAFLSDTLTAVETKREDAMLRIIESKAAAGESSNEVTNLAMRICGGTAFRKEIGIERHFRDACAANAMASTTDQLYDFVGKALCGMPLI